MVLFDSRVTQRLPAAVGQLTARVRAILGIPPGALKRLAANLAIPRLGQDQRDAPELIVTVIGRPSAQANPPSDI
jgi:hypothetical protein